MAVPADGKSTVRFSIFELDLKAGELRRNGSKVRLQEQPFQILVSLLEQPGQVVSRDELRSKLWPADTFVDFDHSLNAAIRRLRDALGDSADSPRFVETVARRGYRFIAPVARTTIFAARSEATVEPAPAKTQIPVQQQTAAARRLRRRGKVAAVALALISCGIAGVILMRRSTKPPEILQRRLTANRESGYAGYFRLRLKELQEKAKKSYVSPYDFADFTLRTGDREAALKWLEAAYAEHSPYLIFLHIEPRMDGLRSDPRFQDLLRRIGLTEIKITPIQSGS